MIYIACNNCGNRISHILTEVTERPTMRDEQPYTPKWQYYIMDDEHIAIHHENLKLDRVRWNPKPSNSYGCCGTPYHGIENHICISCKNALARWIDECSTPHFVRITRSNITLHKDTLGGYFFPVLGRLEKLNAKTILMDTIQTLFRYKHYQDILLTIEVYVEDDWHIHYPHIKDVYEPLRDYVLGLE